MALTISPKSPSFARAFYKFAASVVRRYRVLPTHPDWAARAEVCERCPLRVIQCGRSYCGKPYLQQTHRDLVREGCGCPTHPKAKDPTEHCPIDRRMNAAVQTAMNCNCKWCARIAPPP